jgi:tRNA modification GTPase
MVVVYRSPKSYTGEDAAEISCHGSLPGIRRILDALMAVGFRRAEPGEFTRRAFMNGKLDLTQAEAVQEIVSAKTHDAHAMALDRLRGAVFAEIDAVKGELLRQRAAVEVQLDYPDDEVEAVVSGGAILAARRRLLALAQSYDRGRLFRDGVRVAIAGPTNAGKSSLFNLLLRHDRAIVSPTPGTTRDYLEAEVDIGGVPVRLFDTAGFREAVELVESEGIERSGAVSRAAHLVLYVVDSCEGMTTADVERLAELREHVPVVLTWNKVDVPGATAPPDGGVALSVVTGVGLDALEQRILSAVLPDGAPGSAEDGEAAHRVGGGAQSGAAVIDSLRQKQLLERAADSLDSVARALEEGVHLDLVAVDMKDAMDALGEITGEITAADVLDTIFSGFCVGK